MVSGPTIRLKKTELPLTTQTIDSNIRDISYELVERIRDLCLPVFEKAEDPPTGVTGRTRDARRAEAQGLLNLRNPYQPKFSPHVYGLVGSRAFQQVAAFVPWVVKVSPNEPLGSNPTFHIRDEGYGITPSFSIHVGAVRAKRLSREEIIAELVKLEQSRQVKKIKKYLKKLDWECIKTGLPARIKPQLISQPSIETLPDGDMAYRFVMAVSVSMETTDVSIPGARFESRLTPGRPTSRIPAHLVPISAKEAHDTPDQVRLESRAVNPELTFTLRNQGGSISDGWFESALRQDRELTSTQKTGFEAGVGELPAWAELASPLTLLEKFPELKQILKTMARLEAPYDYSSFIPVAK